MRTETNEALATRNKSIASYLFIATLVVLVGGFFFVNSGFFQQGNLNPGLVFLQALVLPISFVLTLVSIRMTNLWARPPRPEAILPEAVKGVSKKAVLYNYYHLPVRHLLICPQGVFVIVTRWHDGAFVVNGSSWKSKANPLTRFFSALRMDGVGNPTDEAQKQAQKAQNLLEPYAPGIKVEPIIVFVNSKAQIEVTDSPVPIVFADSKKKPNLKDYLRDMYAAKPMDEGRRNSLPLTDAQMEAFEKATLPSA